MKRILFTRAEAVEVLRALELISSEDLNCDVNMDAQSVAAKASALRKLEVASGMDGPGKRLTRQLANSQSFDVRNGKR